MAFQDRRLEDCLLLDQRALRRRLHRLHAAGTPNAAEPRWAHFEKDVARCEERARIRRASVPDAPIAQDLPIAAHAASIVEAIREHRVVIVSGDTGSGKSTQLPKLCLAAGRGRMGQIAHTQPRRVAARSIARRIADELAEPVGRSVGYKVRFDSEVNRDCFIKVVTDGLLLAELSKDRHLLAYDTVIIDEAHERSLNIDFLLGHLKLLLLRRPELKVVVSSATLEQERLRQFFDDAPLIQVQGRSYPIEIEYWPAPDGEDSSTCIELAVSDLTARGPGDILVFLSGEREIHDLAARLRAQLSPQVEVLALYARLPTAEQDRVFEAHTRRRVILATNLAETSLTVPGVRFVVDLGRERVARHSPGSAVQRLPVEPISQASAVQRAGRCGREGPGICVRLYSQQEFDSFRAFSQPEIMRTELASVLLRMRAQGIHSISRFPFLDAPARRHVNDGLRLLRELGALDEHDRLTAMGRQLARFPLDPRIARMLLAAKAHHCVQEILIIAAGLTVADVRERRANERAMAPQHLRFQDERSDFLTLLNIWRHLHQGASRRNPQALKTLCQRRRLSYRRVQEWREVHLQLSLIAREMGLHPRHGDASYARIHRALLAGLVRHVGLNTQARDYQGIRGHGFRISRRSGQYAKRPRWVMAAQIVDAGHPLAHVVARIRSEWIEEAAGALLRRTHFDAYWDARRGEPMVYEQTALYALTVTSGRRVRFAPVSRSGAREVFIRAAFVEGQLDSAAPFVGVNRELLARRRALQQRLRQPDPEISDDRLYDFFEQRLPPSVVDVVSFNQWWRQATPHELRNLELAHVGLGIAKGEMALQGQFPQHMAIGQALLPLAYKFAPGASDDGITVDLPRSVVRNLDERAFEWLVPGLIEEKVRALLRVLPKSMRRRLASVSDVTKEFLAAHPHSDGSLLDALRSYLALRYGLEVAPPLWSIQQLQERLPPHLLMRFRVLDDEGQVLAQGRSISALRPQRHTGPRASTNGPNDAVRYRVWPQNLQLDVSIRTRRAQAELVEFPALYDHGNAVSVVRVHQLEHAEAQHRHGVLRLARLDPRVRQTGLARHIPNADHLALLDGVLSAAPPFLPSAGANGARSLGCSNSNVHDAVLGMALERACFADGTWQIRSDTDFNQCLDTGCPNLARAIVSVCDEALGLLNSHRQLRARLTDRDWPQAWALNISDIDEQLSMLIFKGFLGVYTPQRLKELPRYLAGVERRLDKLERGGARDGDKLAQVRPLWERFVARARGHQEKGLRAIPLERYRWMLEEFRLSVFAQELGSRAKVSRQRLDRAWDQVPP